MADSPAVAAPGWGGDAAQAWAQPLRAAGVELSLLLDDGRTAPPLWCHPELSGRFERLQFIRSVDGFGLGRFLAAGRGHGGALLPLRAHSYSSALPRRGRGGSGRPQLRFADDTDDDVSGPYPPETGKG
ncbi:hypothetical protein [Streptomyces sp. NPDC055013]